MDHTAINYDSLTELHPKYHCNYSTLKVCSFFPSCILVTGFKTVRLHPNHLALILHSQVNWIRVRVGLLLLVYRKSAPLGVKPLETPNQYFFQPNACGYRPYLTSSLTEDGSVIYNCCWPSPAQSLSGPSLVGLMTTLYCLRFESLPNLEGQGDPVIPPGIGCLFVPSMYSQGYGGGIRTRFHTGKVSLNSVFTLSRYNSSAGTTVSNTTSIAGVHSLLWRRVYLQSLPSNGSGIFAVTVLRSLEIPLNLTINQTLKQSIVPTGMVDLPTAWSPPVSRHVLFSLHYIPSSLGL
jgi:hypothetical protein